MKRSFVRVLCVDRYPVVRAGMKAMLRVPDITVVGEAQSADEALRFLAARRADIVLAHLRLAEAEEIDHLARLKEKFPKVAVVLITGNEDPHFLARTLALGCSGFIHERAEPPELQRALRAVAKGECVVDPSVLPALLKEITYRGVGPKVAVSADLMAIERDVLRLIAEGQTNRAIADRLGYKVGTVKDYVQRIIEKLEVSDRTQAAVKAVRLGLLG